MISRNIYSCWKSDITHDDMVNDSLTLVVSKLRVASLTVTVVKHEHMETCGPASLPVLLQIIVLRLLRGKLLPVLVLFGGRAGWQSGQTWRNYQHRDTCILVLIEEEHIAEKLNWQSSEMNTAAAAMLKGDLPYCFLLFQTWYFVDDDQTVGLSYTRVLWTAVSVFKWRCDTRGAPLDADEFSSCWCDS